MAATATMNITATSKIAVSKTVVTGLTVLPRPRWWPTSAAGRIGRSVGQVRSAGTSPSSCPRIDSHTNAYESLMKPGCEQALPLHELAAATGLLRQLDFHAEELWLIDTDLGQAVLGRPEVLRLMTVPGID